jgi:hypothetical protein
MCAIELGNLPEMAEVVRRPLVEHLRQGNDAEFGVLRGTRSRRSGNTLQKSNNGAPRRREARQMLQSRASRVFTRGRSADLIVSLERRRVFRDHAPNPLGIHLLEVRKMRQNLQDRPAVRPRLPLQPPPRKSRSSVSSATGVFSKMRHRGLNVCNQTCFDGRDLRQRD